MIRTFQFGERAVWSLVMESDVGAKFARLIYQELQDGTRPGRIGFYAHWHTDNRNQTERFLDLLAERYPSPSLTFEE